MNPATMIRAAPPRAEGATRRIAANRFSYANVAATLALFFALSGSAFAGAQLFVSGANVKNHSLTGVDVKKARWGSRHSRQPPARS
jgi:hypothetical protein